MGDDILFHSFRAYKICAQFDWTSVDITNHLEQANDRKKMKCGETGRYENPCMEPI